MKYLYPTSCGCFESTFKNTLIPAGFDAVERIRKKLSNFRSVIKCDNIIK